MNDTGATSFDRLTRLARELGWYERRFSPPDPERNLTIVQKNADKFFTLEGSPPVVIPEYKDAYNAVMYLNYRELAAVMQYARILTARSIQEHLESESSVPISCVADNMVAILEIVLEDKNKLKALYEAHSKQLSGRRREIPEEQAEHLPYAELALSYQALINITDEFISAAHPLKRFSVRVPKQAITEALAEEVNRLIQEYDQEVSLWGRAVRLYWAAQGFAEKAKEITGLPEGPDHEVGEPGEEIGKDAQPGEGFRLKVVRSDEGPDKPHRG